MLDSRSAPAAPKLNVLLIVSDDLRDAVGCFGNAAVKTPYLDRLAARGVRFDRAYAQYPVCNPSRTSFMTGLRCEQTGVTGNTTMFRTKLPDIVTLPQMLRQRGWWAGSYGKIFHVGEAYGEFRDGWMDVGKSWDDAKMFRPTPAGRVIEGRNLTGGKLKWCEWGATAGTDDDQPDGQNALHAIRAIEAQEAAGRPWFVGAGFHRPHDPFVSPKKYFDLYPPGSLQLYHDPTNASPLRPLSVPRGGFAASFNAFTDAERTEFLRGYYAGVSFMDAQVGRLMDTLDRLKLWDRTLVIFAGDNGYHHNERNWWNKDTLFERSCRVPLIICAPGARAGEVCRGLVELVDLYPTIADFCGTEPPHALAGKSLRPLLENPSRPGKDAAFTLVTRGAQHGQTVRTDRWRFTRWSDGSTELYDEAEDREEMRNLADDPSQAANIQKLSQLLDRVGPLRSAAAAPVTERTQVSQLWGAAGEKWSPTSRLPDFSFAGYRRGEEPFRIPKEAINVTAFGARGDGVIDDTAAFKKAIAAGDGKVILIPAGRFVLSDVLEIRRSNVVLRGAGSDKTVLLFTKPLEELRPRPAKTDGNQPTSGWSWGGGLIMVGGREAAPERVARVSSPAQRGTNRLTLERAMFDAGDEVVLTVQDDQAKSLVNYLYRGQAGDISGLNNWKCRQVFRVTAANGNSVALDRPLRFDARREWQPRLESWRPAVTDVGVEGVAFEFPAKPYAGHFRELGFNPVVIEATAAHCWLRDLRIWNADSGPYINGSFCTLDGIRIGADAGRKSAQGHTGHHGITFYGHDGLCTNFSIETQFIHDVTVQSAMGCVYCAGRTANLNMDHHRWAPYENLFTDIDAGEGTRLFSSSGGGNRGAHTAAGSTFWNIRTRQPATKPRSLGIDAINIVGVRFRETRESLPADLWYEPIPPEQLQPANLYEAMRARRHEAGK